MKDLKKAVKKGLLTVKEMHWIEEGKRLRKERGEVEYQAMDAERSKYNAWEIERGCD